MPVSGAARMGVVERLAARLGAERVESGQGVWRYACAGVPPACVVRPQDAEEVRKAVRAAADERLAVVPCGEGIDLDIGWPPARYDAALCLREVHEPWRHDRDDFVVTVGAGLSLAELNERLAPHGQWLALDPPLPERRTVGGIVAADRSGPSRIAYGRPRDLLLGLRAVRADGEWLQAGGRVVKNVAGYDLCRLLTGSFGTLAVIVEATFRLHPLPPCRRVLVAQCDSLIAALEFAFERLRTDVLPEALEVLNGPAAEQVGLTESPAVVAVYAGDASRVDAAVRGFDRAAPRAQEVEGAEREAVLRALRDFSQRVEEDFLLARLSVPKRFMKEVLARVEGEAKRRELVAEIAARPGSGMAWCQLGGGPEPMAVALFAEWIRVHVRQLGGWLVFESLPPGLRGRVDPWGMTGSAVELMRGVKAQFDPDGRLAPGRLLGGSL